MKPACKIAASVILLLGTFVLAKKGLCQEVDLVRLGYDDTSLTSKQVGAAVSADGKFLVVLYQDKSLIAFDINANRIVAKISAPVNELDEHTDLRLTDSGQVAVVNRDNLIVFPWRDPSQLKTFNLGLHRGLVTSFLPSLNYLAIAGQRSSIGGSSSLYVIDLVKMTQVFKVDKVPFRSLTVAIRPDGKAVAVAGMNGSSPAGPRGALHVHEIPSGNLIYQAPFKFLNIYTMVTYDESGERLFVGGSVQTHTFIRVLDSHYNVIKENFESLSSMKGHQLNAGVFYDNKLILMTMSGALDVYDYNSGRLIMTTKNDRASFMAIGGIITNYFFPLGKGKFFANIGDNNINQIYDANANAIVGYFFTDGGSNFAAVSRDGRVDGTADALSKVYWTSRRSSQKAPLISQYDQGFTPRLFSLLVTSGNQGEMAQFNSEEIIDKMPVLRIKSVNGSPYAETTAISTTQKKLGVDVEITSNVEEAKQLSFFQNGKLQTIKPVNGSALIHFETQLTSAFGDENFLAISATTTKGTESAKTKLVVTYKGSTAEQPRLFLLTVGLNQYRNPKYNLNYALADADAFQDSLKTRCRSLFSSVNAYSIRNENATRETILKAMEQIAQDAREQDVFMFYYAGHGVMSGEAAENKEFFLAPYDITQLYGKDDLLTARGISASELKKYSQLINAQKQVYILDACQSAAALTPMASRGVAEEKAFAQLAHSTGTFWITATGADQYATEFEKLGHGVFTFTLLEGVSGQADTNKDLKLTIKELSTFVENRVPELSEQLKGTAQFPSAYSFGNDFPLMTYKRK